jgi:hypothetical protein
MYRKVVYADSLGLFYDLEQTEKTGLFGLKIAVFAVKTAVMTVQNRIYHQLHNLLYHGRVYEVL